MNAFLEQLRYIRPGPGDLFEIALVAILFYRILVLVQRTRAMQMLLGVVVLALIYGGSRILGFTLIQYLLEAVFQYGAIALLVIFQPELRSALARLGQSRFMRVLSPSQEDEIVEEIVEGVEDLANSKIGAIIALQQEVGLEEYAATGKPVQARVSAEMLNTIFTPYSPLHDGAVIVEGDMITAAGAILPLTQYPVEDKTLGTRHRAAIGLSEETDAVVIVVSEETSRISVAQRGRIEVGVDLPRLKQILSGAVPDRPKRLGAVQTGVA